LSGLRRNLLIDPEMPLDFGHSGEKMIDLFREPGVACTKLLQAFNAAVDHRDLGRYLAQAIMSCAELFVGVFEPVNYFRSEIFDARIELRNVLLRRHVLPNVGDIIGDRLEAAFNDFTQFSERRFLCHMAALYHAGRVCAAFREDAISATRSFKLMKPRPPLDPDCADEVPRPDELTSYDMEHLVTYLRVLDAEADNADWTEVARIVLHIDPTSEPARARRAWESHLARAEWMTEHGPRTIPESRSNFAGRRRAPPRTFTSKSVTYPTSNIRDLA
jgi:hypothetical protein